MNRLSDRTPLANKEHLKILLENILKYSVRLTRRDMFSFEFSGLFMEQLRLKLKELEEEDNT